MTPASRRRRAFGYGERVENSIAGRRPGDDAGGGQGVDVGVGEIGAVVGRGGADRAGQLDAGALAELVGVDAGLQTAGQAGLEDRAALVLVEGASLHEHVDPLGVLRGRVEHRPGHQRHVARRVVGVLGRDDVRPQVRRLVGEVPRDLQRPRLVARPSARTRT